MPVIKCDAVTCTSNVNGLCAMTDDIKFKFRFAGDFGNGRVVFFECVQMELPQDLPGKKDL